MHAKVVSWSGEQARRGSAQRDGRLGAMAERQQASAVMSDTLSFDTCDGPNSFWVTDTSVFLVR